MWLPHWHCAAHAWEARGTSEISQGVKWLSYAVEIIRNTRLGKTVTLTLTPSRSTRSRQTSHETSTQSRVVVFFFYRRWSV